VEPFLTAPSVTPLVKRCEKCPWLSLEKVGEKVGKSRSGYAFYRILEQRGTITLNNLRKGAEAMDCELVYFIRPKEKVYFNNNLEKII